MWIFIYLLPSIFKDCLFSEQVFILWYLLTNIDVWPCIMCHFWILGRLGMILGSWHRPLLLNFDIFGENCSTINGHSSQTKQNTLLKCILRVYKIIPTKFLKSEQSVLRYFYLRSKTEVNDQDHPVKIFHFNHIHIWSNLIDI